MKKHLLVLLLAALLLLSVGCAKDERGLPTQPTGESGSSSPAPEGTNATDSSEKTEPAAPEQTDSEALPAESEPSAPSEQTEPAVPASTEAQGETQTTEYEEPGAYLGPLELMGNLMYEEGEFTDEYGDLYTYYFDLPLILDDSADAAAINREIEETFGADIRNTKEEMEQGLTPSVFSISYYGEAWEDVLTVVVKENTIFDIERYGIYCYDSATRTRLTTPMLLEKMGISQKDFLAACEDRFIQYFKDEYSELPADRREEVGYYDALARVASSRFVNMDLMAYPDWDGDIVVIAPIVSLAGPDYRYHPIWLGLGGED